MSLDTGLEREIQDTCFPLWGGNVASQCLPETQSTKHLEHALILYGLWGKQDTWDEWKEVRMKVKVWSDFVASDQSLQRVSNVLYTLQRKVFWKWCHISTTPLTPFFSPKQTVVSHVQVRVTHTHFDLYLSTHEAHMCSHLAGANSAASSMCVRTQGTSWHENTVLRRRKRRKRRRRCGLTISTDVLTTSETLCLSSAAVPGLPRPRVNLLVSGCAGVVAIVARCTTLHQWHVRSPELEEAGFTGGSSPVWCPSLGSTQVVRTASLRLAHGVARRSPRSDLRVSWLWSLKSDRVQRDSSARAPPACCHVPSLLSTRVCSFSAQQTHTICWSAPPLTGVKARPVACLCVFVRVRVRACWAWTLDREYLTAWMTESIFSYDNKKIPTLENRLIVRTGLVESLFVTYTKGYLHWITRE